MGRRASISIRSSSGGFVRDDRCGAAGGAGRRHPRGGGRAGESGGAAAARAVVGALRAAGVDGVVLGCTEIPLLLGEAADAGDLVNPLALLAEATVRYALEETRVPASAAR